MFIPATQLRGVTSAIGSFAPSEGDQDRYIYMMIAASFYKYDTWNDVHIKLQTPPVVPVTGASMTYSKQHGYYGNVLGFSANTLTIAGLNSQLLVGQEIEIISGTGVGQKRTISSATDPMPMDSGVVTSVTSTSMTDSTKRWKINEFIGYQVRIVYGAGAGQTRKILYNNETTLTLQDPSFQKLEPWNNTVFSSQSPYAIPVATAGAQSNYIIEKSVITVDSDWDVVPDYSSAYVIKGGGVFLFSSSNSTLQYYDILSDTWTTKTNLGGLITGTFAADFDIQLTSRDKIYLTGTASAGAARTLTDTSKSMTKGRWVNFEIRIIGGTGIGQRGLIVSNGTNYFEIEKPWSVNPDATSTYEITANGNAIWLVGNSSSSIYKYSIDQDQWHTGPEVDFGIVRTGSCQFPGQEAFGITSGVRNTGGITALNATPTAAGTGYAIGDVFNITTGGTVGKGRVTGIGAGGVVTSIELYSAGLNYTTGTGKATSNVSGTGTGLTVEITTVGVVGRITLATNHNLATGDVVTFAGLTEALWNAQYTILAADSLTTFDVITTATANMAFATAQSTTVIVDAAKNWAVNEHVGKIIKLETAGTNPTTQLRRIVSNTANSITVATIVAGVNGTSPYTIMQPEAFGRERMYEVRSESGEGYASSGSTTTLVDSSKSWVANQWANFRIRIVAGTGVGNEFAITSNTANTLTYSTQSFTPDATTKYVVMGSFGIATSGSTTTLVDTTKNWIVNMWAGKRLILTSGTGQRNEYTITSNTANTLTFSVATAPDATTCYTILSVAPRATVTALLWIHTTSDDNKKGNFLASPRGAFNTFDWYDISQDKWDINSVFSPQSELLTTNSCFAYDGADGIFFSVSTTGDFLQINKIDVNTRMLSGGIQTPFVETGTHVGKYLTVISSPDGGRFIFLALRGSRLLYKALIS